MWHSAIIDWLGEWACPDFGETFKCKDIKPLKRVGKLANRRNQAQVQSGIITGEQKKYERRTRHTDLSFLIAGALLQGIKADLSGAVPFIHWNLLFPPDPLFRWVEQKCFSRKVKIKGRKGLKWMPSVVRSPSVCTGSCFQQCQVTLSICLSFPQPPSVRNATCA